MHGNNAIRLFSSKPNISVYPNVLTTEQKASLKLDRIQNNNAEADTQYCYRLPRIDFRVNYFLFVPQVPDFIF